MCTIEDFEKQKEKIIESISPKRVSSMSTKSICHELQRKLIIAPFWMCQQDFQQMYDLMGAHQ
jgi:hypothetical protein